MRRMYSKPQLLEAVEQEAEVNGLKAFENIVDKDGHKRFIEGDITLETTEGITQTYGKWSLSGSHLMIVVAGTIANGTSTSAFKMAWINNIPQWILDKIVTTFSNVVEYKLYNIYNNDFTSQQVSTYLGLDNDSGKLFIQCGSINATAQRIFRFAYDLLIDNE